MRQFAGMLGRKRQPRLAHAGEVDRDVRRCLQCNQSGMRAGGDDVAGGKAAAAPSAVIGEPSEQPPRMARGIAADGACSFRAVNAERDGLPEEIDLPPIGQGRAIAEAVIREVVGEQGELVHRVRIGKARLHTYARPQPVKMRMSCAKRPRPCSESAISSVPA